jgi:hypothetical protein
VLAWLSGAARALRHLGAAMERTGANTRRWPVAGVLLLALTITILAAQSSADIETARVGSGPADRIPNAPHNLSGISLGDRGSPWMSQSIRAD